MKVKVGPYEVGATKKTRPRGTETHTVMLWWRRVTHAVERAR